MKHTIVSRRQFVRTSAAAAGSVAFASLVPAAVFGANDRIRIGVIGCGGQGTGHVHSLVSTLTNDAGLGDRIFGKYGTMELGGDVRFRFNADFANEFAERNEGKEEVRIPVDPLRDLEGNWIDAMRGQARVHCNVDLGCATMIAIKMAVESYRQRKTMLWDATTEKVVAT